jgi:dihydroxy-acid dehydratase
MSQFPLMTLISVLDLGKTVKAAVQKRGMIGWQFNTVGVSDGITMGGDGT